MYKRILVALDNSTTAAKALAEAITLAKATGAKLCAVHCEDEGPLAQHGMGLGTYVDVEAVKNELRAAGDKLLANAVAKAAAEGVEAESRLLEAENRRVAELLVDAADKWQADLIVMGTHGRRGFARLLVGSVAENLVRVANTSLMLVREH